MQVNPKDLAFMAVGGSFVALIFYIAWNQADDRGQSRFEGNPNLGKVLSVLDTGDHYFHPNHCVTGQDVVFTQHRYPQNTGANASTMIHRGFSALRKPAPQDDDWRVMPPGEVQF